MPNSTRKLSSRITVALKWLGYYLVVRLNQLGIFARAFGELTADTFNRVKSELVSRMFWGRGSLYKNLFHYSIVSITVFALITGVVSQLSRVQANQTALESRAGLGATDDLLQQGGSIQSVLAVDPLQPDVEIDHYTVKPGDTLAGIAQRFKVSMDTIRWANSDLISPFANDVEVGWNLNVPLVDGVLYKVKAGQTLDDVAAITGGNKTDIIELNYLVPPDYVIHEGQHLFVPSGELPESEIEIGQIPKGVFDNPLTDPKCAGYHESRGFSSYHHGVDLALWGGCPVRAIATGKVLYAGWKDSFTGYMVEIDHGGGIVSMYFHSTGEFWVKTGDRVQQGQPIMMMGSTGNSTGTHLHLELRKNKKPFDPRPYVPF
jgi:murein DD-endopeptidase MepM/ murein hydrolase activator NlpD